MLAAVGAADCRNGRPAGDDELVGGASLVGGTRLRHHEVVEVQPENCHPSLFISPKKICYKFFNSKQKCFKNIIYLDYFTNFGYFRYLLRHKLKDIKKTVKKFKISSKAQF